MPTATPGAADPATPPEGSGPAGASDDAPPPTLWRRLASMLYEGVLLFGVLMVAGLLYGVSTQQRHALHGTTGLQILLFAVLGLYFVWFWTHGGQTVAMKTWHLRLVCPDGRPVPVGRAVARYLASWIWFVPGLAAVSIAGLHGSAPTLAAVALNVAAVLAVARLHPSRQFLHDLWCGTRLVMARPAPGR